MIRNYIILAFRNIRRNLGYTFLNVFGLTLGVAASLVIFLIVKNELSYEGFNKKADRIYRVTFHAIDYNSNVSVGIGPKMRAYFPELEQVTQVFYSNGGGLVKVGDKLYNEKHFAAADKYFTKTFDYDWVEGDKNTALNEPNSVVLTQSQARKYFGDANPMGRVINLDQHHDLKVTGIMKDAPGNTSMPFDFLVSLETYRADLDQMQNIYAIPGGSYLYVVLPANVSRMQIQSRIHAFIEKNWGKDVAHDATLLLQPLTDIHFDQRYINNITTPTSRDTYYVLTGVALLIIITACINFVNLATAQSAKRAREVGVRKVLGARRQQLISQFLGETTVLVMLSVLIGVFLATLFLNNAEAWLDIKITAMAMLNTQVISWICGLTIFIILLAGLYPAFVQSAFLPVDTLKGDNKGNVKGITLRRTLVVAQFAISQILIIGTIVVARQMDYFENRDLGFDKDAVITMSVPDLAKHDLLKNQLTADPGVRDITFASAGPAYNNNFTSLTCKELGFTKDNVTEVKQVDEHYIDMFGIRMLAGNKLGKDTLHHVVVNTTLINAIGIQDPQKAIGHNIELGGGDRATITGVMQDFQSESKHKKIRACVMFYQPRAFYSVSVRLQPSNMPQTIARIEKMWSAAFPANLFQYEFMDQRIASMYRQEQKVYTAFRLFSAIAILIGCLGLYGLIAFAAAQRTKEISIRKVLGAPFANIVLLFSKEFMILITIAFCVAAPLGYYLMHAWLQNFAYHINVDASTFVVAILSSVVIAAVSMMYKITRTALTNPMKALRSE